MLSADDNENRPIGKAGPRKAKTEPGKKAEPGKKSEARKRKDVQQSAPKPDQLLEALQRLGTQVDETVSEPAVEDAGAPIAAQVSTPAISSESSVLETPLPEMSPVGAAEPAEATSVSLQTIADAYGDYSKKSLEQTSSFVAKLVSARSLGRALELQTNFAREAYETFVAESIRIRGLHRELAKQRLARLEGVIGMTKLR
jgi:hypothetical protein